MERSGGRRWDGDVRATVRVYGGWFVALVGAILCAVGWYGVSGEKYEARQIPYLASASIPGAALIVAGAVLIAARTRGRDAELRRRVAELHALLVELPAGSGAGRESGASAGAAAEGATASPDAGATRADDHPGTGTHAAAGGGPGGGTRGPDTGSRGSDSRPSGGAAPGGSPARAEGSTAAWLAVPDGKRYHRPDCALVAGKPAAYWLNAAQAAERGLRPCPLCDPDAEDPGAEGAADPPPASPPAR